MITGRSENGDKEYNNGNMIASINESVRQQLNMTDKIENIEKRVKE